MLRCLTASIAVACVALTSWQASAQSGPSRAGRNADLSGVCASALARFCPALADGPPQRRSQGDLPAPLPLEPFTRLSQSRHGRDPIEVRLLLLLAAALSAVTLAAHADDTATCAAAIATAERKAAMPPRVLGTIALVESGRAIGRRVRPLAMVDQRRRGRAIFRQQGGGDRGRPHAVRRRATLDRRRLYADQSRRASAGVRLARHGVRPPEQRRLRGPLPAIALPSKWPAGLGHDGLSFADARISLPIMPAACSPSGPAARSSG